MRILSFAVPVIVGILLLVFAVRSRPGPALRKASEKARPVRVIRVRPLDVRTRARGFGTVVPSRTWRAVARVAGKVVTMHPELKKGVVMDEGTVILQIDPAPYELTVTRLCAVQEAIRAEVTQLAVQAANHRASLKIEERTLVLKEKELGRQKKLFAHKTASEASVESLEQVVLAQKAKVQGNRNSINLIPSQRVVLEARLREAAAQIKQARLDVTYTKIEVPYLCRITERRAELAAFVQAGQELVTADGLGTTEVHLKLPGPRLVPLIEHVDRKQIRRLGLKSADRMKRLGFSGATVLGNAVDSVLRWPARLDRITGAMDAATRTLTAVVVVDGFLKAGTPRQRAPLFRGMLCEVELRGRLDKGRLVVPRAALRDGGLHVVDSTQRLRRRRVRKAYAMGDLIVIKSGLSAGERVVVSDLEPAVEGMLLAPVVDEALEGRIVAEAAGKGASR